MLRQQDNLDEAAEARAAKFRSLMASTEAKEARP
jgi:hypothetical protein